MREEWYDIRVEVHGVGALHTIFSYITFLVGNIVKDEGRHGRLVISVSGALPSDAGD